LEALGQKIFDLAGKVNYFRAKSLSSVVKKLAKTATLVSSSE